MNELNQLNRHIKFWLTTSSLITMLGLFIFIGYNVIVEEFTFKKEYCLFILPSFIYLLFQFILNYCILISDEND